MDALGAHIEVAIPSHGANSTQGVPAETFINVDLRKGRNPLTRGELNSSILQPPGH